MLTIGAHWSPLESIVDNEDNNLIKVLLSIGAHCSPLELDIEDEDDNNLIKKLLAIEDHWSPFFPFVGSDGGTAGYDPRCMENSQYTFKFYDDCFH